MVELAGDTIEEEFDFSHFFSSPGSSAGLLRNNQRAVPGLPPGHGQQGGARLGLAQRAVHGRPRDGRGRGLGLPRP